MIWPLAISSRHLDELLLDELLGAIGLSNWTRSRA